MLQTVYNTHSESPDILSGDSPFVGRFAPSPTGRMHAGNIFSALISWLLAKKTGGEIVLRIEDLDRQRSRSQYIDQVMRDFTLLGLTWDRGPFFQHDRDDVYADAFNELQRKGLTYPCYCTRADLHAASAPHAGEKPIYAGTCRHMSSQELEAKRLAAVGQGRDASFRLIVPDETYSFEDLLQGHFEQNLASDCGDFVIRRSDNTFAYQLAVVIDDAEQGINCVTRGFDLLSSTPQQLYLQSLLQLEHPCYAHVPLLMGSDGHRLSKRHADADLQNLIATYGSPEAIIGHISFDVGIIDVDEPISCEQLLKYANLKALHMLHQIVWNP